MNPKEEARIANLLTMLWQRNLPLLHQRLEVLDRAASESGAGSLTEATRLEALSVAHKLSGTLGMFGHDQGTEIAREIELILTQPTVPLPSELHTLTVKLRQILLGK